MSKFSNDHWVTRWLRVVLVDGRREDWGFDYFLPRKGYARDDSDVDMDSADPKTIKEAIIQVQAQKCWQRTVWRATDGCGAMTALHRRMLGELRIAEGDVAEIHLVQSTHWDHHALSTYWHVK